MFCAQQRLQFFWEIRPAFLQAESHRQKLGERIALRIQVTDILLALAAKDGRRGQVRGYGRAFQVAEDSFGLCAGGTGHQADKARLQAEEGIVILGASPGGQPLPQLWEEDGIEGMISFGGKAFIKMKSRKQLPWRQAEIITVPRGLRRIE